MRVDQGRQQVSVSPNQTLVELHKVSVNFGKLMALKEVDLVVKRSEMLFITGRAGAGKTTLLKVIEGLISPDRGQRVCSDSHFFMASIDENRKLLERMSVWDNLALSYDPEVHHSFKNFRREVDEMSKILGLKERLYESISNLSAGFEQKVCIIRAVLTRADLILADGPTHDLDQEGVERIFDLFDYLRLQRGVSILWATHQRELVKRFGGRHLHLDKGVVSYLGNTCFI